jgi:hypothetical protein
MEMSGEQYAPAALSSEQEIPVGEHESASGSDIEEYCSFGKLNSCRLGNLPLNE